MSTPSPLPAPEESEERRAFRETLRRFFAELAPMTEVRRIAERDTAHDSALWGAMAGELGLPGLAIPEACGGQGFGLGETTLLCEELRLARSIAGPQVTVPVTMGHCRSLPVTTGSPWVTAGHWVTRPSTSPTTRVTLHALRAQGRWMVSRRSLDRTHG